jgi:voltage-gated sodium channel
MRKIRNICYQLAFADWFEWFIIGVILTNAILIGVQTAYTSPLIEFVQDLALYIFTAEIFIRFTGRISVKSYVSNAWNWFDISLVLVGYIPEGWVSSGDMLMALRVLRVFRVLRLLKAFPEVRLIVAVLVRSFSALFYNMVFFFIFLYLFSLIGVTLFQLPTGDDLPQETIEKLDRYEQIAPGAPANGPDPYGNVSEAFFTLFRILTGEDWTDLRYNLITASNLGLVSSGPTMITSFHVLWFIISAFLLLNLLVGAIINNYQVIMDEEKERKQKEAEKRKKASAEKYKKPPDTAGVH